VDPTGDLERPHADLTNELLGITILSRGGTTTVPKQVREVLKLKPTLHKKEKLLWTEEGNEVVVRKGTPQSSFRKTMLRRGGRTAVPKHIRKVLNLESTFHKEERMLWIRKGDEILVRKGALKLRPTD
jgi:bifunctional DNA-binding transcriptional regulator/antitoxin component of YhaV-PrlF toxin-antitoxin module